MRLRPSVVAVVASVLAGCGSVPITQPTLLTDGVYEFDQHRPVANFSGHLEIAGDSVHVLDSDPLCFEKPIPKAMVTSGSTQQFTCGQFTVIGTRQTTGRWSLYYLTTNTVRDASNTCIATASSAGRSACTDTKRDVTERQVTEREPLALKKLSEGKPAP